MKNLLFFTGSCGHVEVQQISDAQWEKHTAPFTLIGSVGIKTNYRNPTRIGRKTRAVYISPERFFLCQACALAAIEDTQAWGED